MAEGYDNPQICAVLHLDQEQVAADSESIYKEFGLGESTAEEPRMRVIRYFMEQIHRVPLSIAHDAGG